MRLPNDLTHRKFGRLTPKHIFSRNPVVWECLCDCGNVRRVSYVCLVTGKSKSCGCLKREMNKKRVEKRPFEWLYNIVRKGQKWIDLTYEEFLEFTKIEKCHYCGAPLRWHEHAVGGGRYHRSGHTNLDRKDNAVGYTKQNLVVCCPRCNAGKSDKFSYEEWVEIGKVIRAFQEESLILRAGAK